MTRDGVVVVTHDETLQRVYGVHQRVSDCSHAELLSHCSRIRSPPIPKLDDVFAAFPHTPIHLDVKAHDEQLMQKVLQLVVAHDRKQLTMWGSFNESTVRRLAALSPDVPRVYSTAGILRLLLAYYSGILPFISLRDHQYSVPAPPQPGSDSHASWQARPLLKRWAMRCALWLIDSPRMFRHLQARGVRVTMWTLNSRQEVDYWMARGADSFMTDTGALSTAHRSRR